MCRAWRSWPHLLRSALGYDRVLSDADVALLAATGPMQLWPAA
jgi:hypothetical protein